MQRPITAPVLPPIMDPSVCLWNIYYLALFSCLMAISGLDIILQRSSLYLELYFHFVREVMHLMVNTAFAITDKCGGSLHSRPPSDPIGMCCVVPLKSRLE